MQPACGCPWAQTFFLGLFAQFELPIHTEAESGSGFFIRYSLVAALDFTDCTNVALKYFEIS